jgi:archaellum component FlaF (FlaF/FlaG flagellin family)
VLNDLYYQDGTDPEIFGQHPTVWILTEVSTIFIDSILGQPNYVSPNGVTFTNGLKVRFTGDVVPVSYGSGTVTITCTGTQAGSNFVSCNSTAELYEGEEIVFSGTTAGGIVPGQSYYIKTIGATGTEFSLALAVDGATVELIHSHSSWIYRLWPLPTTNFMWPA